MNHILSLADSNKLIIKLLERKKPFLISRVGIGPETHITYVQKKDGLTLHHLVAALGNNTGIYNAKNSLVLFADMYAKALQESTALAVWKNSVVRQQCYFIAQYGLPTLSVEVLEPFYSVKAGLKPWSHALAGKRVLIVNPFVESFQKQLTKGFRIFKNERIFLPEQEFIFYKTFVGLAGNRPHANWLETYKVMRDEISALDFDVALLGCGGYGLLLARHIKVVLCRSAIYIGGGLQLLFGVMGKRWEGTELWKEIIAENNCKFIRPSLKERVPNHNRVEGGCYW